MELVIGLGWQSTEFSRSADGPCPQRVSVKVSVGLSDVTLSGDALRAADHPRSGVATWRLCVDCCCRSRRDGAEELVGSSYSRDVDDDGRGVDEVCEIHPTARRQ